MKFNNKWLRHNVAWGPGDGVTIIYDNVVDSTRWSVIHEVVFQHDGVYYKSSYRVAATECQDEDPYEYNDEETEVTVVEPYYVVSISYLTADDVEASGVKPLKVDGGPFPVLARLYVTEK